MVLEMQDSPLDQHLHFESWKTAGDFNPEDGPSLPNKASIDLKEMLNGAKEGKVRTDPEKEVKIKN